MICTNWLAFGELFNSSWIESIWQHLQPPFAVTRRIFAKCLANRLLVWQVNINCDKLFNLSHIESIQQNLHPPSVATCRIFFVSVMQIYFGYDRLTSTVTSSSSFVELQQKLKKLYLGISQAQRKDHNWHKTTCLRGNSSFIWIWCTQPSLVQILSYKDTQKQRICNIVSKTGEVLHSIVTLTHSLSHFHDIGVASLPNEHP